MSDIMRDGNVKSDRTGTGTLSLFGQEERYNICLNTLPVVTTKKVHLKSVIHELLWFLKGDTNIKYLNDNGVSIWDAWADENGDLGPIYSKQWRNIEDVRIVEVDSKPPFDINRYEIQGFFKDLKTDKEMVVYKRNIDQISNVIELLKNDPDSRRIIVNAWHVPDLDHMALTPCHAMFQFYTRELTLEERLNFAADTVNQEQHVTLSEKLNKHTNKALADSLDETLSLVELFKEMRENCNKELDDYDIPRRAISCKLTQRSTDTFLGKPFNLASYALLTMMLGNMLNMVPEDFIWSGGDNHVYLNHIEQANLQLTRTTNDLPTVTFREKGIDIRTMTFDDIIISDYESHPSIKAPISV